MWVGERSAWLADNDDDGESGAGSKLAHLLEMMKVKDVCVIVSRRYGGIQLGPDRFKHISTCARSLLIRECFAPSDVAAGRSQKGSRHS